jgi:catechol 2,3-dioxygenase-like lactoylglutathione lyase family enzyme
VAGVRPRIMGVLETVLYYRTEQEEAIERFYRDVLGLRPLGRWGWMMAFRAGGDAASYPARPPDWRNAPMVVASAS